MKWQGRRQSGNIEDRRRIGGRGLAIGGGGIGTIVIVLLVVLLGGNPGTVLDQSGVTPGTNTDQTFSPQEEQLRDFSAVVLADTEEFWTQQFQEMDRTYQKPVLVLFTGSVQTGSGFATSQSGPFYSPADQKIYIDLSFFEELTQRFGAPGDFAQAYVIAHEVGHHVQKQLGILDEVSAAQRHVSQEEANELSVRLELQADFLAGLWAHFAQTELAVLEPGDIEEALTAATAIGDDRLQMQAQGTVNPDTFTHGTSEQRVRWFSRGYQTGDISQGDTFGASSL